MSSFEDFKRRIHAFRMPISSRLGLNVMRVVYFTVPIVFGWYVMEATNSIARENLGVKGEKLLAMGKASRGGGTTADTVAVVATTITTPSPRS